MTVKTLYVQQKVNICENKPQEIIQNISEGSEHLCLP